MAVSAYDKVLPWDPINYFQIESNLGKDRLDRQDKQQENYDKFAGDLDIPYGPSTKNTAAKLQSEVVTPGLNHLSDLIAKGADANTISKAKRSLVESVKQRPEYFDIQNDISYNKEHNMWGTVAQPDFGNNIQDFYQEGQGFKQHDPNTGRFDPSKAYSNVPLIGINEDPTITDLFAKIKPEIDKQYGTTFTSFTQGPNGEIIGAYNTTNGTMTTKIDDNTIRGAFAGLAQDPTFIDQHPSLRYKKAYNKGQYDNNMAVEDLTKAFVGKYSNSQDLTPIIRNAPIPKGSTSTASNSTNTQGDYYNPIVPILKDLQLNGETTLKDPKKLAAFLGAGEPDKNGMYDLNLGAYDNKFIDLADAIPSSSSKESDRQNTSIAIQMQAMYNEIIYNNIEKAKQKADQETGFVRSNYELKANGNIIDLNTGIATSPGDSGYDIQKDWLDDAKNRENTYLKQFMDNDPKSAMYNSLKDKFKINPLDAKWQKKTQGLTDEDINNIVNFSHSTDFQGMAKASPAGRNNLFVGTNHDLNAKMFVIVPEDIAVANLSKNTLNKLIEKKIAKSAGTGTRGDGSSQPLYSIPISIGVSGTIPDITEKMVRDLSSPEQAEKHLNQAVGDANAYASLIQETGYLGDEINSDNYDLSDAERKDLLNHYTSAKQMKNNNDQLILNGIVEYLKLHKKK